MPQNVGLLAYRNRRGVLLDLSGWDERRDARDIQAGKRSTEAEQQGVFAEARSPIPSPEPVPAPEPEADPEADPEAVSEP